MKTNLFLVFLIAFIDWIGVGLVYPMFSSMLFQQTPLLIPESGEAVRGFWLGVLLAMMPLAQFVSAPFLGFWSDQKGRKPLLVATLFLSVIGYGVSTLGVLSQSLFYSLIGRALVGFASGNVVIASAVLGDLCTAEDKTKQFGMLHMAAGLGFTFGPFLGGQLSTYGFHLPFLLAALCTSINLILLVLFFKESHAIQSKSSLKWFNWNPQIFKELKWFFIAIFIFRFGWVFYWELIPICWIKTYRLEAAEVGALYAYAALFYALSCGILIRPFSRNFHPFYILQYGLLFTGFYIFMGFFIHPEQLFWYLPLQQFGIALIFPTAVALVSNWASKDKSGEIMGFYQSIEALSFGLSPILAGPLVALSDQMPIAVGSITMLVGFIILRIGGVGVVFRTAKEPAYPTGIGSL